MHGRAQPQRVRADPPRGPSRPPSPAADGADGAPDRGPGCPGGDHARRRHRESPERSPDEVLRPRRRPRGPSAGRGSARRAARCGTPRNTCSSWASRRGPRETGARAGSFSRSRGSRSRATSSSPGGSPPRWRSGERRAELDSVQRAPGFPPVAGISLEDRRGRVCAARSGRVPCRPVRSPAPFRRPR